MKRPVRCLQSPFGHTVASCRVPLSSSANGHSGGFHVLPLVDSTAVSTGGLVFLQDPNFNLWINTRSGTAGSYGSSISDVLRTLYTIFYWATHSASHEQGTRVPATPCPCHGLVYCFYITAVLTLGHQGIAQCGFDLHFSDGE